MVSKPLTPASDAAPPSRRSFSKKPQTGPARPWWGGESCGRDGSPPTCFTVFPALRTRTMVSGYWRSHPSTMSKEARKRATRPSQPNSRSSITVSRGLSHHRARLVNVRTVSPGGSAPCFLRGRSSPRQSSRYETHLQVKAEECTEGAQRARPETSTFLFTCFKSHSTTPASA